MIAVSKRFLCRADEVWAKNFRCLISTAKDGLFKRESTVIFRINDVGSRTRNYEPLVKILYADGVSKRDRRKVHDDIVFYLNERADAKKPPSLDEILLGLDDRLTEDDRIRDFLFLDI